MSDAVKKAIITGGTSGIGLATAKLLAQNGYEVKITGSDEGKWKGYCEADETLKTFKFLPLNKSLTSGWSTNNNDSVEDNLKKFNQQLDLLDQYCENGLDALVLNAGIAVYKPIFEETIQNFSNTMAINVQSHYFIVQKLIDRLKMKKGSIIFVSSIITDNSLPFSSIYATSKGAVNALANSLSAELAPDIRVNTVSPGAVDTPLVDSLGLDKAARESIEQTIPLKSFAKPEQIAEAIYSLINLTYATGTTLTVDGGVSRT